MPGIGVFGGVRRFLEIGNELVRRGHRYVLYHPDGTRPEWLPFAGEVRPLAALHAATHPVLLCGEPHLLPEFEAARAALKLFYCVLERLPDERRIVTHPGWVLLANSSGIRARLQRRYGVLAEDAIGGIDLARFHPAEPARAFGDPIRILAYGRASRPRKGTRLAIRAAEILAWRLSRRSGGGAGTPPVQLVLFDHVGPGNEGDPRPALRCRVPHEIRLNLPQEELARLYRSCDLFVSAERRAGWSNTVAEAMASGLPVVCTQSGTRDLAQHLETAWVARWRHPLFLAAGLARLSRDSELRLRLGQAARVRVSNFSWARVAGRLEAIVRARQDATESAGRSLSENDPILPT